MYMGEYYKNENQEYYNKCIKNYDSLYNTNTPINNNEVTLNYLNEIDENKEYKSAIEEVIINLENCEIKPFIPNMSEIYKIDKLNLTNLIKIIMPYFEKLYNSHLKIIDTKILKHLIGNHYDKGAFIWHYDNHPKLVINIMIYLNDVNEDEGAFEIITINNNIIKFDFSQPCGNRSLESYVSKNYDKIKIKQVLGNCGKLFYFDNNIGHRPGPKINKERTAVILQLYPSLHKVY